MEQALRRQPRHGRGRGRLDQLVERHRGLHHRQRIGQVGQCGYLGGGLPVRRGDAGRPRGRRQPRCRMERGGPRRVERRRLGGAGPAHLRALRTRGFRLQRDLLGQGVGRDGERLRSLGRKRRGLLHRHRARAAGVRAARGDRRDEHPARRQPQRGGLGEPRRRHPPLRFHQGGAGDRRGQLVPDCQHLGRRNLVRRRLDRGEPRLRLSRARPERRRLQRLRDERHHVQHPGDTPRHHCLEVGREHRVARHRQPRSHRHGAGAPALGQRRGRLGGREDRSRLPRYRGGGRARWRHVLLPRAQHPCIACLRLVGRLQQGGDHRGTGGAEPRRAGLGRDPAQDAGKRDVFLEAQPHRRPSCSTA